METIHETDQEGGILAPPAYADANPGEDWVPVQPGDPLPAYIEEALWEGPKQPSGWKVAHLLGPAYLYWEKASGWRVVAKFYSVKMGDFVPTYIHGDATTANFTFLDSGELVGTDWERLHVGDPADDVGRLMAEVTHSIVQYGGSVEEAEPVLKALAESYCRALPEDWDAEALLARANFYRAQSTLRIARNDWLDEQERTALAALALSLLA